MTFLNSHKYVNKLLITIVNSGHNRVGMGGGRAQGGSVMGGCEALPMNTDSIRIHWPY